MSTFTSPALQRSLSLDQVRRLAPSAFAVQPYHAMSDKYQFIPTSAIIEGLMAEGWVPVKAQQNRARIEDKKEFTKHMIRFQRPDSRPLAVGDVFPEIIVGNAHDGLASYRVDAGLFRLACLNGMCVSDSCIETVKIPHRGNIRDQVIDASYTIIKDVPLLAQEVKSFRETEMTPAYAKVFAAAALELKYPSELNEETGKVTHTAPIEPSQIIRPRRWADKDEATNLWGVFNMAQENLIQGGVRGRASTGRRISTRAVASVSEDIRLNKALWTLATEMRNLLGGA